MHPTSTAVAPVALALLLLPSIGVGQALANAGFERGDGSGATAAGWTVAGRGCDAQLDDAVARSGDSSFRLRCVEDGTFGVVTQTLDAAAFRGAVLRLSGSIRTAGVSAGYAGLWLRVDGPEGTLGLDNMRDRGVTGDTEWARRSVQLAVPDDAARILLGALLPGRGTAWFDDLALHVVPDDSLPAPSVRARAYLDRALTVIQERAYMRDSVDWPAARREAFTLARDARTPAGTYPAVRAVLRRLGDRHSFLMEPAAVRASSQRSAGKAESSDAAEPLPGGIGHVRVPSVPGGPPDALREVAQSIQDGIAGVDARLGGACGWVVDLRENTGGNMWPMLAGVGPILGGGPVGAFESPDGTRVPWGYAEGSSWNGFQAVVRVGEPYTLLREDPPVAVLSGPRTASSGEAVVVAFRERPRTRSFGAPTRGLSTANTTLVLDDGARLLLTTAVFVDRAGHRYGGPILPDVEVSGAPPAGPAEGDPVLDRALEWLRSRPECRERRRR